VHFLAGDWLWYVLLAIGFVAAAVIMRRNAKAHAELHVIDLTAKRLE
jgi:F0F1-type ATP synthase assembly protein I